MDINKLTIEEAREITSLLGGSILAPVIPKTLIAKEKPLVGKYVIVRCRDAGVHAGTLENYFNRTVELSNSRRLWYWECAGNQHTLSGVASVGITSKSKIPAQVDTIILLESCEIIATTKACEDSIKNAQIHFCE